MSHVAIREVGPPGPPYRRHRPEQTRLYLIVDRHYPAFRDVMATQGRPLPLHVQQEFAGYHKCGHLEHGFLRVQCTEWHHEHLVALSCKRRGLLRASCPPHFGPAIGSSKSLLAILSAPVVVQDAWRKVPHCWSMRFCLSNRYANGC
jgi:hypothetical protein